MIHRCQCLDGGTCVWIGDMPVNGCPCKKGSADFDYTCLAIAD